MSPRPPIVPSTRARRRWCAMSRFVRTCAVSSRGFAPLPLVFERLSPVLFSPSSHLMRSSLGRLGDLCIWMWEVAAACMRVALWSASLFVARSVACACARVRGVCASCHECGEGRGLCRTRRAGVSGRRDRAVRGCRGIPRRVGRGGVARDRGGAMLRLARVFGMLYGPRAYRPSQVFRGSRVTLALYLVCIRRSACVYRVYTPCGVLLYTLLYTYLYIAT